MYIYMRIWVCLVYCGTLVSGETVELYLGQHCGQDGAHSLPPSLTHYTGNLMRCLGQCGQTPGCTALNYVPGEGDNRLCQLYTYDTVSPCSFVNYTQGATYLRKKEMVVCVNGGYPDPATSYKTCFCPGSWIGQICDRYGRDCTELFEEGKTAPGSYAEHWIKPPGLDEPFLAYCCLNWGGSTVIQRNRMGDTNCPVTFDKTWDEYKRGFNMLNVTSCGLWLGNDNIHYILRQSTQYDAQFGVGVETDRWSDEDSAWVKWHKGTAYSFMVQNETYGYKMTYDWYHEYTRQPALDSLDGLAANTHAKGMLFSTPDQDNDLSGSNCAALDQSGWWYNDCSASNVNRWPPQWENDLANYTERYS